MAERWYVIQGKRGREVAASVYIASRGIEAYVPLDIRTRTMGPRFVDTQEPRFGMYFFARFDRDDMDWRSIMRTPDATRFGIVRVLGNDPERPAPVPDEVIAAVRAYEADWKPVEPHRFQPGDACIISVYGQRMAAVFVDYLGGRQFVRTWIFGSERVCEVAASEIEAIDREPSNVPHVAQS